MVLGVTHRYRSKYVTVVMYKPRDVVDSRDHPGAPSGSQAGKKR